ncbi:hypothetical protein [Parashewanella tropica]|uniref:hypothetical protein n=1 Tax=Parashewanella tropica TaxID=2547970 RepID=UPI0010592979|nr:hypothetical protein [Parashewanella tropica]
MYSSGSGSGSEPIFFDCIEQKAPLNQSGRPTGDSVLIASYCYQGKLYACTFNKQGIIRLTTFHRVITASKEFVGFKRTECEVTDSSIISVFNATVNCSILAKFFYDNATSLHRKPRALSPSTPSLQRQDSIRVATERLKVKQGGKLDLQQERSTGIMLTPQVTLRQSFRRRPATASTEILSGQSSLSTGEQTYLAANELQAEKQRFSQYQMLEQEKLKAGFGKLKAFERELKDKQAELERRELALTKAQGDFV